MFVRTYGVTIKDPRYVAASELTITPRPWLEPEVIIDMLLRGVFCVVFSAAIASLVGLVAAFNG